MASPTSRYEKFFWKRGPVGKFFFRSLSSPSHLLHATGEKRLSHWWETRKKPFPVGDPPSLVAAEGNSRSDSHFSSDGLCGLFVISWWNFVLIRRTDRHVYHTLQGAYLSIYSVKTTIRINCPCLCTYANQSDPHPTTTKYFAFGRICEIIILFDATWHWILVWMTFINGQ